MSFLKYYKVEQQPICNEDKSIAILTNSLYPNNIISTYENHGINCTTFLSDSFILYDKNSNTTIAFNSNNSQTLFYGETNDNSLWISTKLLDKRKRKNYKALPQNCYFLKKLISKNPKL